MSLHPCFESDFWVADPVVSYSPFSGYHGERWEVGEIGSMVGIPPQPYWILRKIGRKLAWLPPLCVRSNALMALKGRVNVEQAWMDPQRAQERKGVAALKNGGVWITWSLRWKVAVSKACLWRGALLHVHLLWEAEYEGYTCRKWRRRGEVRRKSPWLLLKYGNWWSGKSLDFLKLWL